jgi:hypothetical protein
MRNDEDKGLRGKSNNHVLYSITFENHPVYEMWKNISYSRADHR